MRIKQWIGVQSVIGLRDCRRQNEIKQDGQISHAREGLHTHREITKLGWTTLSHLPYSPDLAPPDCHLFVPLKDAIQGKRYDNDEQVIGDVRTWL